MLNENSTQTDGVSEVDANIIHETISLCKTVSDACDACKELLTEYQNNLSFNDPNLEAKIFVEHALSRTSLQLITQSKDVLSDRDKQALTNTIIRRVSGYPVAYIVGHQPFWTLDLNVSADTLIPRADSEVIVETAISLPLPENANVLDLGTGTGAIALAVKAERPHWLVSACDYKSEIIELAKSNAQLNKLDVSFILSDWFSDIEKQTYDLIVSNPPYVESNSVWLQQGDVRFEPLSALTSGIDGLDDIRHIIYNAKDYLNNGGYILLEHGEQQALSVQKILLENGYESIDTIQDLNDLDRVTIGRLKV
jgi:release factor glutamine methyltransferase